VKRACSAAFSARSAASARPASGDPCPAHERNRRRYKLGGVIEESCPAIYGRRVFVLCGDRHLYAFS
jgi:hypothetical protein